MNRFILITSLLIFFMYSVSIAAPRVIERIEKDMIFTDKRTRFTYTITWDGPPDLYTFIPPLPELPEGLSLETPPSSSSSIGLSNRLEFVYRIRGAREGEYEIPATEIHYRNSQGEEMVLRTHPITLKVISITSVFHLKGIAGWEMVLAVISLGLVVGGAVILWRRRGSRISGGEKVAERTKAVSLEDMDALKRYRLDGDWGAFFTTAERILDEFKGDEETERLLTKVRESKDISRYGSYVPSTDEVDIITRGIERKIKRVIEKQGPEEEIKLKEGEEWNPP